MHFAQIITVFLSKGKACDGGKNVLFLSKGGNTMKDIPFFTTDYGVAGLILKEVPYKKEAYIRILEAQPGFLPELLK